MKKKKSKSSGSDVRREPFDADGPRVHERFLTVSLYPEKEPHIPWIRLRGRWLQEAGFTPSSRVRVRVMKNCLVLTKECPAEAISDLIALEGRGSQYIEMLDRLATQAIAKLSK